MSTLVNAAQKQNNKWIAGIALLSASALGNVGCTSEEIGTAIGVGAIIGGAVLIGANTRCEGGYVTRCTSYRNYWGQYEQRCRSEYDSCAHIRPRSEGIEAELADKLGIDQRVVTGTNFAVEFGMSFEGSDRLVHAFETARDGQPSELTELGFSKDDQKRMAKFKSVSDESVDAIARNLNEDRDAVKLMLTRLTDAAKAHKNLIRK